MVTLSETGSLTSIENVAEKSTKVPERSRKINYFGCASPFLFRILAILDELTYG